MVIDTAKDIKTSRTRTITAEETTTGEAIAFCPKCKALQTVLIDKNKLMMTRKFYQKDKLIYHDCGSTEPCRLYFIL